jgi:hypothetical protein
VFRQLGRCFGAVLIFSALAYGQTVLTGVTGSNVSAASLVLYVDYVATPGGLCWQRYRQYHWNDPTSQFCDNATESSLYREKTAVRLANSYP